MLTGQINAFHSLSAVDGPGLRVVVFMQGCPLRCKYCHNPETQALNGGKSITADGLVKKVLRYKAYLGEEGGLTVSGGEPLLHIPFITEVFARIKQENMTTCIETSGQYLGTFERSVENMTQLLGVTDYIYCDLKFATDELYREHTGVGITKTLDFLRLCETLGKQVIVRHVVMPGINDTSESMAELLNVVRQYKSIERVELLPYSTLGKTKYAELGRTYELEGLEPCSKAKIKELQSILDKHQWG